MSYLERALLLCCVTIVVASVTDYIPYLDQTFGTHPSTPYPFNFLDNPFLVTNELTMGTSSVAFKHPVFNLDLQTSITSVVAGDDFILFRTTEDFAFRVTALTELSLPFIVTYSKAVHSTLPMSKNVRLVVGQVMIIDDVTFYIPCLPVSYDNVIEFANVKFEHDFTDTRLRTLRNMGINVINRNQKLEREDAPSLDSIELHLEFSNSSSNPTVFSLDVSFSGLQSACTIHNSEVLLLLGGLPFFLDTTLNYCPLDEPVSRIRLSTEAGETGDVSLILSGSLLPTTALFHVQKDHEFTNPVVIHFVAIFVISMIVVATFSIIAMFLIKKKNKPTPMDVPVGEYYLMSSVQ
ncbi:hypothetical protein RCL1_005591 [Eukaryota sp. TZLM3-RCL]